MGSNMNVELSWEPANEVIQKIPLVLKRNEKNESWLEMSNKRVVHKNGNHLKTYEYIGKQTSSCTFEPKRKERLHLRRNRSNMIFKKVLNAWITMAFHHQHHWEVTTPFNVYDSKISTSIVTCNILFMRRSKASSNAKNLS